MDRSALYGDASGGQIPGSYPRSPGATGNARGGAAEWENEGTSESAKPPSRGRLSGPELGRFEWLKPPAMPGDTYSMGLGRAQQQRRYSLALVGEVADQIILGVICPPAPGGPEHMPPAPTFTHDWH
jgi:hypothetical protein